MKKHRLHGGVSGTAITIRVTPHAERNEISGIMDDGTIKIRITAELIDGKANQALKEYLAEIFQVKLSKIEVIAGHAGRNKLVAIEELSPDELEKIIHAKIF
ncbi:MAG: DUF167 domain-containing protein [Anaerolineaceae bacterium]|nr:DUF167 domain-containing protein [Anaerolineaceae bacterium]